MSEQASRFVGSIPEHYDRYLVPVIFPDFANDIAARAASLNPSSVLELAAGTGIVSEQLRSALSEECVLTVTDLNTPMLEVAKSKFSDVENTLFETVDAMELPYEDASFDVVVCQFGVMFFPDKQKSYAEVLRVLKPGGIYLFNVWGSWASNPFAQIVHETVAEFFPDNPPGFYRVPFHYHDTDKIERTLSDAGFSTVVCESVKTTSAIPSAQEFSTGLVFGNPMLEEVTTRGGDPEQIRLAIETALDTKLGSSMPLQAYVISAAKE